MDGLTKSKNKKPTLIGRFRSLSLIKKAAIILIVLLLLWAAGTKVFGQKNSTAQYQTATAQRGSIISTVNESGNINASSQTSVTSPANGLVQDVYVKDGDHVTVGEKLFSVKAVATPQVKASAYANYESALASYNSATNAKQAMVAGLEKDRDAILTAQDAVNSEINNGGTSGTNPATKQAYTQLQVDSINSALTSANESFSADETKYNQEDTAIAASNASLASASLSYQATQNATVVAPIDGTVANLAVIPGDAVSASTVTTTSNSTSFSSSSTSSTNNGSSVLVIGNLGQLSVLTQVNEVDVPNIKTDQQATITLDAIPNETFVGKVQSVDSIGTISSGVVTYNVYISLIDPPSQIKAGMTASVAIQTNRADNAIYVPTAAIQTANGSSYVRVLKNNQVTSVPVTTGIADDTNTVITSGISEGDVVVTGENTTTTSSSGTSSPFSGIGGRGGFGGGGGFGGAGGGARTGGGGGARGG